MDQRVDRFDVSIELSRSAMPATSVSKTQVAGLLDTEA